MRGHRRKRPGALALALGAAAAALGTAMASPAQHQEAYTEGLTLRPLADGRVHALFEFVLQSNATPSAEGGAAPSDHFRLLPRSLIQIARATGVEELTLSLHRGTWDYERWGSPLFWSERTGSIQGEDAVGAGAEIWATIAAPASPKSSRPDPLQELLAAPAPDDLSPIPIEDSISARWKTLTASLAGMFCASLDAADEKVTVRPLRSHLRRRSRDGGDAPDQEPTTRSTLYAALPSENICTENLAPLLKLLPCKASAGLAQLLSPHAVLSSGFHGLNVHVAREQSRWTVRLVFQAVFSPAIDHERRTIDRRDWTLYTLFQRELTRSCPLSDASTVTVLRPPLLRDGAHPNLLLYPQPHGWEEHLLSGARLQAERDAQQRAVAERDDDEHAARRISDQHFVSVFQRHQAVAYDAKTLSLYPYSRLNLGLSWRDESRFQFPPPERLPAPPSLSASRALVGSGQEAAQVVLRLTNRDALRERRVLYAETLPWLLKPHLHSLRIAVDTSDADAAPGEPRRVYFRDEVEPPFLLSLTHQPPLPRERSFLLEAELRVPPSSTLTLTYDVAKEFLRYTEHLPDAHRGFDLPSAVITPLSDDAARPARIYLQPALLEVAVPDFSMPYNVIIMTSTVIALFFGSVFNNLTRRYGDVVV